MSDIRDAAAALAFRNAVATAAGCRCQSMPVADSPAWRHEGGWLRHRTGRFFAVAGLAASPQGGSQPIVVQPEIGTLCMLRAEHAAGPRFLCHAKVEPGNVDQAQFAPTCQATASNLQRVHGGEAPPYAELVAVGAPALRCDADVLQSEQGTRFLAKRNRNLLLTMPEGPAEQLPVGATHAWLPGRVLQQLLLHDHAVNTDARSTLVSGDWRLLATGEPFRGAAHAAIASWLASSYAAAEVAAEVADAERLLAAVRRQAGPQPATVALDSLPGWRRCDEGWEPAGPGGVAIRQIGVTVRGREVPAWDQPFVCCDAPGEVILASAEVAGAWRFLVQARVEPALPDRAEFTPAVCVGPGDGPTLDEARLREDILASGMTVAAVWQSEEGGRFMRNRVHYRWLHLPRPVAVPGDHRWLSLAALQRLAAAGGRLTNEARSALTLVLAGI